MRTMSFQDSYEVNIWFSSAAKRIVRNHVCQKRVEARNLQSQGTQKVAREQRG